MVLDLGMNTYDYYSSRRNMEVIAKIVDTLKEILEEDSKQQQPLFLKISDNLIMNIARMAVQERKKTFLIGITGESASGKTVFGASGSTVFGASGRTGDGFSSDIIFYFFDCSI